MFKRLIKAVEQNNIQKVKQYLNDGDNIHYNNDNAFRYAAYYNHFEIVKFLLDHGANIHALDDQALYWAAERGYIKIVKLLLDRGADRSTNNYSALKWAKENNHKEVVDLLENYFPEKLIQNIQDKNLKTYNTDGRLTCYKCGSKLKQVVGFTGSNLNYCPNCEG